MNKITSVTSKGQVTIPKLLRQQLGLRQGSKVEFVVMGDHAEMRVFRKPADVLASGFGMLKSKRVAVPTDFICDCDSMASFDNKQFAQRAKRMGRAPRVVVPG
jgi:AbrB family looped-hinge helix DNA binding protein